MQLAPSSLQEETHLFLEARNISGIIVSQQLRSIEQLGDSNQKIFVGKRLGPIPSGFLILRSDTPVIYWNTKVGTAYILRVAVDRRQLEKVGSVVLSATYYTAENQLILEDVLFYNNSLVYNDKSFSERWKLMSSICQTIIKPDISKIQKFEVSVAKYISLEEWSRIAENSSYVWEFVLDKPRWRRLLFSKSVAALTQAPVPKQVPRQQAPALTQTAVPKQAPAPRQQAPRQPTQPTQQLLATVEPDTTLNLPDAYVLYADQHALIGPAAIRKLNISLALRSAKRPTLVRVQYNPSFKKYEILEVLADSTAVQASPEQSFDKRT